MERWFRELTDKAIRRGVFVSVPDLCGAIYEYLDAHNADPKPFVWTASVEAILEKVAMSVHIAPSTLASFASALGVEIPVPIPPVFRVCMRLFPTASRQPVSPSAGSLRLTFRFVASTAQLVAFVTHCTAAAR